MRGGFHASGDLSLLAWLTLSVTAHSCGMSMSLANCVRLAVDQLLAPDCFSMLVSLLMGGVRMGYPYDPGILERDHVVNVDVGGGGPGGAVVGGSPGS